MALVTGGGMCVTSYWAKYLSSRMRGVGSRRHDSLGTLPVAETGVIGSQGPSPALRVTELPALILGGLIVLGRLLQVRFRHKNNLSSARYLVCVFPFLSEIHKIE